MMTFEKVILILKSLQILHKQIRKTDQFVPTVDV